MFLDENPYEPISAPVDAVGSVMGGGGGGMEPMTMALISAGSNVLGKAMSSSPAGPSSARSDNTIAFDHSGWTVATGSGRADAVAGLSVPSWAWLVAGVVLLAWAHRKKS